MGETLHMLTTKKVPVCALDVEPVLGRIGGIFGEDHDADDMPVQSVSVLFYADRDQIHPYHNQLAELHTVGTAEKYAQTGVSLVETVEQLQSAQSRIAALEAEKIAALARIQAEEARRRVQYEALDIRDPGRPILIAVCAAYSNARQILGD